MVLSWRRLRERATAVLHLDEEPSRLAAGMAAGVFIGITPFYGLHTLLALAAAWVFGLNKAATITGAWLNLPWFAPFVYAFCSPAGRGRADGRLERFSLASVHGLAQSVGDAPAQSPGDGGDALAGSWDMLFDASVPLFVGTTIVGLVLAVVAYFITLEAVRDVRRLRARMHHSPEPRRGPHPRRPRVPRWSARGRSSKSCPCSAARPCRSARRRPRSWPGSRRSSASSWSAGSRTASSRS